MHFRALTMENADAGPRSSVGWFLELVRPLIWRSPVMQESDLISQPESWHHEIGSGMHLFIFWGEVPRLYPRIVTQLCPRTLSRLCPRWIVLSISMYCLWTPCRLKYPQVCLAPDDLYVIIPTPPHPTPPFGLIYAQVCLAPDLYVIIPTPPHPTPPL